MDLNLLNLGILVWAAPHCVFYAARHQGFNTYKHGFCFLLVLWLDNTHRGKDTKETRGSIVTPTVTCTKQLPALHQITCWHKNLHYRGPTCLCFSNITHLQKSYICWWDSGNNALSGKITKDSAYKSLVDKNTVFSIYQQKHNYNLSMLVNITSFILTTQANSS